MPPPPTATASHTSSSVHDLCCMELVAFPVQSLTPRNSALTPLLLWL